MKSLDHMRWLLEQCTDMKTGFAKLDDKDLTWLLGDLIYWIEHQDSSIAALQERVRLLENGLLGEKE